ncbi:hypothetical protein XENOCAPTIV_020649, partial [Xenoophorus captivus]
TKLQQNISSSTKTIEELKGQLNQLNDDLGKLQKELQSCQANTSTLNNKFTVDMAHCQSQVLSQKMLCDEKVAAVKLEAQKNMQEEDSPPGDPGQKNSDFRAVKEDPTLKAVPSEAGAVVSQISIISQGKGYKAPELLTNDIDIYKESDPGMEDMLIGQGKTDETANGQRLEEPDEYDGDEQVVGGVDLEKEQRSKTDENSCSFFLKYF